MSNINVLVYLNVSDAPIILRVYREQKISSLLSKKLPAPEFYHVGEYDGYTFLKGLRGSGYEPPSSWQITVNLLNIISLLDCLVRSDSENRTKQINDIQ